MVSLDSRIAGVGGRVSDRFNVNHHHWAVTNPLDQLDRSVKQLSKTEYA
jgi:hypothetical protein